MIDFIKKHWVIILIIVIALIGGYWYYTSTQTAAPSGTAVVGATPPSGVGSPKSVVVNETGTVTTTEAVLAPGTVN